MNKQEVGQSRDGLVSIVVPIYNEERNISLLYEKLAAQTSFVWEAIMVNDGSHDGSYDELKTIAQKDQRVKVINLRGNYGQTAAMAAGFDFAQGAVIIPMDADLQNDPADIPRLLEKLFAGYDVVSGWRKNRWRDKRFSRRLPSAAANWLISRTTGVRLHDYGCTLKAYRRDILRDVKIYGEMHRFIPAFAARQGARVTEIAVIDHPRQYGQTKYGLGRTFRVLFDLIAVKFLIGYATKPMHFFGRVAITSFSVSLVAFLLAFYFKFVLLISFISTPLPLLTALFLILGVQFLLMGLVAEMLTRNYYESSGKKIYNIKEKINF